MYWWKKIERFGFKKNDAFALKIGIKENSIVRLKALITYVLQETLYSVGNSYIAKIDLYDYTVKYLGQDIDGELYDKVLENLASNKKIYIDIDKNIFDYKMYIQELELASELSKMLKGKRDLNQKMLKYDEKRSIRITIKLNITRILNSVKNKKMPF